MNQDTVDELRRMFVDGASPSELMRRIVAEQGGNEPFHFLVDDYFREAFGIPLVRHVTDDVASGPHPRHAHFNRDVVPEIIQRIGAWHPESVGGSWLDGLAVKSVNDHTERIKDASFDELSRVWKDLTESERLFIIRRIAWKDHYWEVIKVLAAMAERLQQKVVELEARVNQELPVDATAGP